MFRSMVPACVIHVPWKERMSLGKLFNGEKDVAGLQASSCFKSPGSFPKLIDCWQCWVRYSGVQ